MNDYIFFWGCVIPNRFPFLEKSTRIVLDRLGVRFREIEGFTCCPEKFFIENYSEKAWHLTAARNLALAERAGGDLLVACNGCYSTFRAAITDFYASAELREEVARELDRVGLEFNFRAGVYHLAEVLHDVVGPDVIKRAVKRPLHGIRVGVHYGCQMLRPAPTVRMDDPLRPRKLDALVESTGAASIDYNSKLMCCGESLRRAGNPRESLNTARVKLLELKKLGADALVVMCPACFLQFDVNQTQLQREVEGLEVPVLYFTELLGLAMDIDPEEMGLGMHRVALERFLSRRGELEGVRSRVPECFDIRAMETCVGCGSCESDCPVVQVDDRFVPHDVIRSVLAGDAEEVITGDDIWKCLECGTCLDLCPNNFGMMSVFKAAKAFAIERGIAPKETAQGIRMFKSTAVLGQGREKLREKLGLDPVAEPGAEELARLLGEAREGKD